MSKVKAPAAAEASDPAVSLTRLLKARSDFARLERHKPNGDDWLSPLDAEQWLSIPAEVVKAAIEAREFQDCESWWRPDEARVHRDSLIEWIVECRVRYVCPPAAGKFIEAVEKLDAETRRFNAIKNDLAAEAHLARNQIFVLHDVRVGERQADEVRQKAARQAEENANKTEVDKSPWRKRAEARERQAAMATDD